MTVKVLEDSFAETSYGDFDLHGPRYSGDHFPQFEQGLVREDCGELVLSHCKGMIRGEERRLVNFTMHSALVARLPVVGLLTSVATNMWTLAVHSCLAVSNPITIIERRNI